MLFFPFKSFWFYQYSSERGITLKSFCANSFRQQFPFSHRQLAIIAMISHQTAQLRAILSFIFYQFYFCQQSVLPPIKDDGVSF